MQLGLLGLIAERGGFEGIEGVPACFEYWSLARKAGRLGYVASPVGEPQRHRRRGVHRPWPPATSSPPRRAG